ncbi:DUF1992 domain-containing protein [Cephalotus follicularis]|uniref:DUF1992 domain-containing protein n=1 Tax=Cephalotus follicularis TaxID=3775 RepID=A0A1Q3B4G9_CEPFO|nr:DUF1992 domain-containing protein [Cephalotus follicularis]
MKRRPPGKQKMVLGRVQRPRRGVCELVMMAVSRLATSPAVVLVGHGLRWSSSSKPDKNITSRLSSVIDAVNDRKLPPELRGQRNSVRSETDIIDVVEQRIWHSMEEGQFENLPGKGKPLNLSTNPHADPAEDTLYRILSKNGFAPEWVELNKEIRNQISEWRFSLKNAWESRRDGGHSKWSESSESLRVQLRDINDKVFRYNLIVPFGRQMSGLKWEKELSHLEE